MMLGIRKKLSEFWLERIQLPLNVKHVSGRRSIRYRKYQVIVVCLIRNAEAHIGSFISHYRDIGVKHIFLLDNGSTDETVSLASGLPDVSIFRCTLPFREFNVLMRRYLVQRFGRKNRWVLCVDVDELFDYPYSNTISLENFLRYLSQRPYTAVVAYLLDMFSTTPLSEPADSNQDLKESYPLYDVSAVTKSAYPEYFPYSGNSNQFKYRKRLHNSIATSEIKHYTGGIRASVFGMSQVFLTKHPLLFNDGKVRLVHQHFAARSAVADISCVLYHYKFVCGFPEKVADALIHRQYSSDSREYECYRKTMEDVPKLCLQSANTRELGDVNDLVEADFLQVSDSYLEWVNAYNGECVNSALDR